jgi:hypothetical protein
METAGRAAVSVGAVSSVGVAGACVAVAGAVSEGAALGVTLASGETSTGTVAGELAVIVATGAFSSLSPLQAVNANKTKNTLPTRAVNLFFLFPEFGVDNLFFSI